MKPILFFVCFLLLIAIHVLWKKYRTAMQAQYIRSYMFPPGLIDKLGKVRPQLELKDRQLVARALRQFFLAYLKSGKKPVAMPSKVVDDLWHEFILYTKHYETFCKQAFGAMMHHTPAVALGQSVRNNDGLRRVWWFACLEENINPKRATRLPLLFALDAKCNIPDGFFYTPNCGILKQHSDGTVYCGGDFYGGDSSSASGCSSGSYDFSSDGGSGSGSGSDSGSGDSGGSDGGGCSGGCGGGGD